MPQTAVQRSSKTNLEDLESEDPADVDPVKVDKATVKRLTLAAKLDDEGGE